MLSVISYGLKSIPKFFRKSQGAKILRLNHLWVEELTNTAFFPKMFVRDVEIFTTLTETKA